MRGVHVLGFIGVLVMMTMVVRPPESAALNASGPKQGEEKLAESRRAVAFMGEISVIDSCYRKHSDEVQRRGKFCREPTSAGPNYAQAAEVKNDERDAPD
jgi:hypothetical protein